MAYRFRLNESFEKGFRRIAREQIDRALLELSPLEVGPAAVHESCKALKRLRALVRLAAPTLGKKRAGQHNAALRKVAHLLSARRDETVLLDTMRKLEASTNADVRSELAPLGQQLTARSPDLTRPLDGETAQQARLLLVKEAKRLSKTAFKIRGFDGLRPGLDLSYRAGRKAMKRAYFKPSDEAFHELRKAVQWHWRQMALLSRAWPDAFEPRVAAARELSQIIGDDHDLAMLAQAAKTATDLPKATVAATVRVCRAEQQVLRSAAEYRVERLFAETPGAFCRRIEAYWSTGRHIRPISVPKSGDQPEAPPGTLLMAVATDQSMPVAPKSQVIGPSQRRA